jgi:MFS transporter, OFA family, oxalate/formate antiporter
MADDVKVLGMKPEGGRWLLVFTGMVIQLCLGSIYAWSVVNPHVTKHFEKVLQLKVSKTEMLIPYIVFLAVFSLAMPLAGPFIEKYGPKKVGIVGGLCTALGWFLASFATSPILLALLYGVVGGLGVGIAYGVPIAVSARWFPDKRGLAVGLTVLGFGFSAFLTGRLTDFLVKEYGIVSTFRIFGAAFAIITALLSLLLVFPPAGWKPAGWTPPKPAGGGAAKVDLTRGEAVKTSSFWGLWTCYTIGTLAGLMAIGIAKGVGTEVGVEAATATTLVGIFAVCNGIGRPIFGWLTDKLSPRNTALLSYVLIGGGSLALYLSWTSTVYIVAFCILWACLGGWLALAPAATGSFFGTKDYARTYGMMFTAYGAGAVIGSILAGQMKDIFGSFKNVFPIVAGLAGLGIVVALLLVKPPKTAAKPEDKPAGQKA